MCLKDCLVCFVCKVFQACGTPPKNPSPEEPRKGGKNLAEDNSSTSAARVEKLVCV